MGYFGVVKFQDTNTIFKNDFFDTTEILKKHPNKRAIYWWKSITTQEYASKVAEKLNVDISTLYKAGRGRSGRTLVHRKLILLFARWLDTDFAIACDQFIESSYKKTLEENNKLKIQSHEFWRLWDKGDTQDLYQ